MAEKLIQKLADGLIIRRSTPDDADALAQFNKQVHSEDKMDEVSLVDWTLDLISGEGPTFAADDFTIVEDTTTGEIVSSACTISQTWSYEGIPIKVGRPELVGTHKDYRRRGLVRQQFAILHDWSKERGELMQAITGIPYYYRQFGYEMTLNLGGGRSGCQHHVPKLKDDEAEAYTFRPASEDNIPFLKATYDLGCKCQMVSAIRDEAQWRYELTGKRNYNIDRREIYIIQNTAGAPVGFIAIPAVKWGDKSALTAYELAPGFSWSAVSPSVIRFLWKRGEELAQEQERQQTIFGFWLGTTHPAYDVMASKLPQKHNPYAFFMRVPDLPALLTKITPALEARLADSAFAHYSGEVKLNFYRDGICLNFENGRLTKIDVLGIENPDAVTANFPDLVFLQLLFGYRTMDELDDAFCDCYAKNEESKNLINALFPKKASDIWAIS